LTGSAVVTIHPNFLERDGKKPFMVVPYEESLIIEQELQAYADLKGLRAAATEEAGDPGVPLHDVEKEGSFG
jgi:hypothetical protein